MHHSATSLVSRLVMMMGAYGGEMTDFVFHPDPKKRKFKFWERKDVIHLNQKLFELFRQHHPQLRRGPRWAGFAFNTNELPQSNPFVRNFTTNVSQIIKKLNTRRPWVTK